MPVNVACVKAPGHNRHLMRVYSSPFAAIITAHFRFPSLRLFCIPLFALRWLMFNVAGACLRSETADESPPR